MEVAGDARGGQKLDRVHAADQRPRGFQHLRRAQTPGFDRHAQGRETLSISRVGVAAVLEHPVQELRAAVHGGGHDHVGPPFEPRREVHVHAALDEPLGLDELTFFDQVVDVPGEPRD